MQSLATLPYANVTRQGRRRRPAAQLPRRASRGLPGHRRRAQVPAPLPAALARRPARRQHRRDRRHRAQDEALQGRHPGHGGRPGRARAGLRPVPARRRRHDEGHHRRARAPEGLGAPGTTRCPGARCARRSTPNCSRPARSTSRRRSTRAPAPAGAFVALDPRDGSVLALGSYPTVRPGDPRPSRSRRRTADRLFGDSGGAPLFNRAIGGSYPTGSTFKPITALGGDEHRRGAARRRHRRRTAASRSARRARRRATPARRRSGR